MHRKIFSYAPAALAFLVVMVGLFVLGSGYAGLQDAFGNVGVVAFGAFLIVGLPVVLFYVVKGMVESAF